MARPRVVAKIILLAEAQNWRCCYCGVVMVDGGQEDDSLTTDHIEPVGNGGERTWENEVAACHKCNNGRGDLDAMVFYALVQAHGRRRAVKIACEARSRRDAATKKGRHHHADTELVVSTIVVKARERRAAQEPLATLGDIWPRPS